VANTSFIPESFKKSVGGSAPIIAQANKNASSSIKSGGGKTSRNSSTPSTSLSTPPPVAESKPSPTTQTTSSKPSAPSLQDFQQSRGVTSDPLGYYGGKKETPVQQKQPLTFAKAINGGSIFQYAEERVQAGVTRVFGNTPVSEVKENIAKSKLYSPVKVGLLTGVEVMERFTPRISTTLQFATFSPLMATSTTGLQEIKANTRVVSTEERTVTGMKGEAITSETKGTAILRTDVGGFKVDFKAGKISSGEQSIMQGENTLTLSRGTGTIYGKGGKTESAFSFKGITKEKTIEGLNDVTLGKSIVKTTDIQTGKSTTGGFYVGSRPIGDTGVFRETAFKSVDSSISGKGLLKINYGTELQDTGFSIIKGAGSQGSKQITSSISKQTTTQQVFSQLGFQQGSKTVATFGTRPLAVVQSLSLVNIQTPKTTTSQAFSLKTISNTAQSQKTTPFFTTIQTPTLSTRQGSVSRSQQATAQTTTQITVPQLIPIQQATAQRTGSVAPAFQMPTILPNLLPAITFPSLQFANEYGPRRKKGKQLTKRTPSLYAVLNNITSSKGSKLDITGLGTRAIIRRKR